MHRRVLHWAVPYYASTVVFVALDLLWGANLRAVAFESYPGLRALYYAVLLACGALARALDSPGADRSPELRQPPGVDPTALVFNFLLCGSVAVLAFQKAIFSISGSAPRGRLDPSP